MGDVGKSADHLWVPVSIGEVVDKITILQIKTNKIQNEEKLANIKNELKLLEKIYLEQIGERASVISDVTESLYDVNEKLWLIEDQIRVCEREKQFDEEFIRLARAVYSSNDERARLKKEINLTLGSTLIEEKSYC